MLKQSLIAYQHSLPKIDTHEHIAPESAMIGAAADILDVLLFPYNCDTLRTAGCEGEEWRLLNDKSQPLAQRCAILERWLPFVRHTAFFRAAARTLELTFGEKTMDAAALCRADKILRTQLARPHYHELLDSMNIRCAVAFSGYDGAPYFTDARVRFVPTVSEILPRCHADIERLEKASGVRIHSLPDFLAALDRLFEGYLAHGVRAIKFGSAYRRTLCFAAPDPAAAAAELESVLSLQYDGDARCCGHPAPCRPYSELSALDDLLTHHLLALCEKHGLAAVFHTAMHAWNDNDPARIHCSGLRDTIRRYRGVNFILLHAGMPFFEEAVLLARYYPNVYLDLTWAHIISPRLTRQAILRILELLPTNRILAFGGDYIYLQSLRGHLEMAMENFAAAFAEAIGDGILDEAQAKEILRLWYFDNPNRIYGPVTAENTEVLP